ncbi:DUF4231 domain-containing protein [Streptomyces sp. NPDC057094]|uniref:DUF4231 domain-containing protein n=1 Tax=Streptomyces sp. NPDC057094 TaxID=3346018 RepID=UPI003644CB4F
MTEGGRCMRVEHGLREEDLPSAFRAANSLSIVGQKSYMRHTRFRLACMILAAMSAAFSAAKFLPSHSQPTLIGISLLLFILTLIAEIALLVTKPEELWYKGRAVAESAKTLAWKFAMRAAPFQEISPDDTAEIGLINQLREVCREAPSMFGAHLTESIQITQSMREIRASPLAVRQKAYLRGRIEGQRNWYQDKSVQNQRKARRWRTFLLFLEFLGAAGCLMLLVGVFSFDIGGIIAAGVASGGAWMEVKQFSTLASAYSLTASELSLTASEGERVVTEGEFQEYVNSAERAISREHTMWLARRSA